MVPEVGEGKAEAVEAVEEGICSDLGVLYPALDMSLPSEQVQKPVFRSKFHQDAEDAK
jgi:hypothetical protein